MLAAEVADLVRRRGDSLIELASAREAAVLDESSLLGLVPDIRDRDVYVCGPEGFAAYVGRHGTVPRRAGRRHPPRGVRAVTGNDGQENNG